MNILFRYISLAFLRYLAMILATLLILTGLIDFIEKVDDFIAHQASLADYCWYPIYSLPQMLAYAFPLAILLAAFATIASLSRTNQLTAMYGSGLNFAQVSRPLFFWGLLFSALSLAGNLWLVPWSSGEADYLFKTKIRGDARKEADNHDLIFRDGNRIISIASSFPSKGEVDGLTIVEFNHDFVPEKRIDADSARHQQEGIWRLEDVTLWGFSPDDQDVQSFTRQAELDLDMHRTPDDMLQLWTDPGYMSATELRQLIVKLETEGYSPAEHKVEEQSRISRAAIPLIMILLGVPFAMQRGRQVSFSLGVAVSLGIFMVYYLLYATFAAIGNAAILPPPIAAWAANLLMTLVGIWLFLNVRD
ncbi:MAG: LPS export ABC transporter permease LptG [Desulfuromonas sp.]|nr:MAG: LPS export ABC transporter permease LptG [Desulfuromonas sp.]